MNYTVPYCAFLLAMGDGKKSSLILKVCHGNSAAFPCRVFQAEITLCFEMFSGVFSESPYFFMLQCIGEHVENNIHISSLQQLLAFWRLCLQNIFGETDKEFVIIKAF